VRSTMTKKIYKYVGPRYLDRVIGPDNIVTLKCAYPRDFNDPYELFLTIDFEQEPGALAFYMDVVGELPQLPTTCFSRSPMVIPMWAHYADNLQGFAIEFDEELLSRIFQDSSFGDVNYRDGPSDDNGELLQRAFVLGKFRYLYQLRAGIFNAAYFTKTACWSYEEERRMVATPDQTRNDNGLILLDVPRECITALICGPRASEDTAHAVRNKADQLGCDYFAVKTGRTSPVPYFLDSTGATFTFDGSRIGRSPHFCGSCKEPSDGASELCSWCRINESHEQEAVPRNSYRLLDHYGLLGGYIEGMDKITRNGSGESGI
jgi:Protein of unknown function (DUF2971)